MEDGKGVHETINQFMNSALISCKDLKNVTKYYRMCELELYLTDASHPDPFTHRDDHQMTNQCWYFHRKGTSYKEGTFKGLDITYGTPNIRHCGILIRSICEYMYVNDGWQKTDNFIEGPCNTVNELICGGPVKDFMRHIVHIPMSIHGNVMDLVIVAAELPKEEIYVGRRYGLSDKTEDPANYKNAPYRFVSMIKKIKKQKGDLVKLM